MALGWATLVGSGPSATLLVRPGINWYATTVGLGRVATKAFDAQLRIDGEHHIPATGPVILAANHVSYVDFIPLAAAAELRGREVRFFARHDAWHQPVVRRALTAMRHIPVDRQVPAAAYLRARSLLKEGELIGNFPEAGISYSFAVRSLMRGTAALALETGAVVVPVALWGTQRIYSVGRPINGKPNRHDLTRGRPIDVLCGAPLRVGPRDDLTEWTRGLGSVLTDLLEELQKRPHHQPMPGEYAPWHPAHLGGHAPSPQEARAWDIVPRAAVAPTWGPTSEPLP